jgi:hypothetical protein
MCTGNAAVFFAARGLEVTAIDFVDEAILRGACQGDGVRLGRRFPGEGCHDAIGGTAALRRSRNACDSRSMLYLGWGPHYPIAALASDLTACRP